jgi:hypothetical protein
MVFNIILSAPLLNKNAASEILLIPPPAQIGIKTFSTIFDKVFEN